MEKIEYIHYGSSAFELERFSRISNTQYFTKPHGGLWASRADALYGWKNFSYENHIDCDLYKNFKFTLLDNANVVHIYSVKDLESLPQSKNEMGWVSLDFEKMLEDGIDAIELHLSEEHWNGFLNSLYYKLYGWDCDSILIMNPDIIIQTDSNEAEVKELEDYLNPDIQTEVGSNLKELLSSGKTIKLDEFKEFCTGVGNIKMR